MKYVVAVTWLAVVCIAGCGRALRDEGFVQREWSRTFREYGIVPVFPPREDVQVGDMYSYAFDPDDPTTDALVNAPSAKLTDAQRARRQHLGMAPRLGTLRLLAPMEADYWSRPAWPRTPDSMIALLVAPKSPSQLPPIAPQPHQAASVYWRSGSWGALWSALAGTGWERVNRLRLVALPDFAVTASDAASIAAVVPSEAFQATVGASFDDVQAVTIRIPMAESCAAPLVAVWQQFADPASLAAATVNQRLPSFVSPVLGSGMATVKTARVVADWSLLAVLSKQPGGDGKHVYVRVITEVYYARAIDFSVHLKTKSGAGLSARFGPGSVPTLPGAPGVQSSDPVGDLNRMLTQSGVGALPGGSIRFVSLSDRSLGLRRLFEHPVAIGFRGITFKVVASTGEIVEAGLPSNLISVYGPS